MAFDKDSNRLDAEDARAWTDRLKRTSNCISSYWISLICAGYACHAHNNPSAVRQRGTFTSKTRQEYFQSFLKWQDHEHQKLHINNVEKDVENLRSGGGEHVMPDEMDLASRDIEDLIATGVVCRTKDGINMTHYELSRALYQHKKRAGETFPKMAITKKDAVICMASARTKCELIFLMCVNIMMT